LDAPEPYAAELDTCVEHAPRGRGLQRRSARALQNRITKRGSMLGRIEDQSQRTMAAGQWVHIERGKSETAGVRIAGTVQRTSDTDCRSDQMAGLPSR